MWRSRPRPRLKRRKGGAWCVVCRVLWLLESGPDSQSELFEVSFPWFCQSGQALSGQGPANISLTVADCRISRFSPFLSACLSPSHRCFLPAAPRSSTGPGTQEPGTNYPQPIDANWPASPLRRNSNVPVRSNVGSWQIDLTSLGWNGCHAVIITPFCALSFLIPRQRQPNTLST